MAEYLTNDTDLKKVADAIRTKGETSAALSYPDGYVSAIEAITTGTELKIVVSVITGSIVTATKGELVVSGVSADGSCTLIVPEIGTWDVKAVLDGDTSETRSVFVTDNFEVVLNFAEPVLNNNSWERIRKISDSGQAANVWSIGDCKTITLDGTVGHFSFSNYTLCAFIIGFDHNSNFEGENRIHFQLAKTDISGGKDICLCDNSYETTVSDFGYFSMNKDFSNSGGWASSQMRTNICGTSLSEYSGTIIGAIPADLRAVLKPVTKYTDNTGAGSTAASAVTATTDYFFPLAEYEVFGSISRANSNEASMQAQYAYYSAGNSKTKYKPPYVTNFAVWMLRSPYSGNSGSFTSVNIAGTISYAGARTSFGFAPGFCV